MGNRPAYSTSTFLPPCPLSPLSFPCISYSRWTDRSLHLCFKTVRATFAAHGSSVMCPLSQVSVWLLTTAVETYDLLFRASPLRDIAPSRRSVGLAPL